jgi:hypothetical protein
LQVRDPPCQPQPVHRIGADRRELELDTRFGNTAQGDGFAVQSYLDHHADKLEDEDETR